MAAGQPTKFNKEVKRQIEILALKGFTDKEMAEVVGVKEQTINNWKKKHPKFFESLKDWKKEADKKIEKSLFERASGYEHPETKVQFVDGKWEQVELTKHYPPDPTSMIFWLKNRKSDVWSDKKEVDVTGLEGIANKIIEARKRASGGNS